VLCFLLLGELRQHLHRINNDFATSLEPLEEMTLPAATRVVPEVTLEQPPVTPSYVNAAEIQVLGKTQRLYFNSKGTAGQKAALVL